MPPVFCPMTDTESFRRSELPSPRVGQIACALPVPELRPRPMPYLVER